MKKLILILAALPFAALAQGGRGPGPGAPADASARFERMEKRMRLARTLGLAEALDLDETQATKMQGVLAKYDDQRKPLMLQVREGMQTLRRAANGDAAAQKQVDQAVKQVFDARAQIQRVDREMFQAVAKDLSPEKRARAAVFLARFAGRFGAGMGPGMGHGGREGMGPGRGPGGPGPGGGPGMRGGMGGGMGGGMSAAPGAMGMGPFADCVDDDCPMDE